MCALLLGTIMNLPLDQREYTGRGDPPVHMQGQKTVDSHLKNTFDSHLKNTAWPCVHF